jgi:hypothetical protein
MLTTEVATRTSMTSALRASNRANPLQSPPLRRLEMFLDCFLGIY